MPGVFMIFGNVWEWCEDAYQSSYDGAPTDGSAWVSSGLLRAWHVAAAGSATPGAVALRIASATAQALGTTAVWASALPGQFIDFFTLCSFSLLPFASFLSFSLVSLLRRVRVLQYSFSGCCFQVSQSGAPRSRCMPDRKGR